MEVIDSAKEINLNKLKNMLDDKYDTRQYRTLKNYSIEDIDNVKVVDEEIKENAISAMEGCPTSAIVEDKEDNKKENKEAA